MPSRQVLLAGGAVVVVVIGLIHRRKRTGSSNGANTDGGNPSTPMVTRNGQGTYDSTGQDTANALSDINTRLAGLGSSLNALDPAKWPANVGTNVGPSGAPAPGGTDPVPGSGVAAAVPPAPATSTAPSTLPWHKPAPLAPTPSTRALSTFDAASRARLAAGNPVTGGDGRTMRLVNGVPTTISYQRVTPRPSTRALSTFDAASRARLAAGNAVTGGDGRTMRLVNGVPTTISYQRVAPRPPPPAPRHAAPPPRRRA